MRQNIDTDKMPLFRCNKCGKLNWEINKTLFFRELKCSICGKSCYKRFDTLYLKSQSSDSGGSLKGLIVDEIIVISELQTGQDIEIPTHRLRSISVYRDDEEMMEVEHREGKIVGKVKDDIHFIVSETGQSLTLKQENIRKISLDPSLLSALGGLFDAVSEDVKDAQKPQESFSEVVQDATKKFIQVKEAILDTGLITISDTGAKSKQNQLEYEKAKTQIAKERVEQVQYQSEVKTANDPLQSTIEKIENIKARSESLEKVKQAYQDDMQNTKDPDIQDMKRNMWENLIMGLMDE